MAVRILDRSDSRHACGLSRLARDGTILLQESQERRPADGRAVCLSEFVRELAEGRALGYQMRAELALRVGGAGAGARRRRVVVEPRAKERQHLGLGVLDLVVTATRSCPTDGARSLMLRRSDR